MLVEGEKYKPRKSARFSPVAEPAGRTARIIDPIRRIICLGPGRKNIVIAIIKQRIPHEKDTRNLLLAFNQR